MAIAASTLTTWQWGLESTSGTAVAATSKMGVESLEIDDASPSIIARPRVARGFMVRSPGNEIPVRYGMEWTASGPANFAELQHWLGMVINQDDVPVGAGPYTWTHTWPGTTVPTLNTYTFERRTTDGTNHIDDEWAYAIGRSITIAWADDGLLTFQASGMARKRQSSTLTAGQSLTAVDFEPSTLSIVDIDSTWANLGTTNVAAQVTGWSLTFNNGLVTIPTADGRTDLDFSTHFFDDTQVTIEARIRMMVKADSGQFATERTAAAAGTLRAVQIQVSGAGNEDLTLKFLGKHTSPDINIIGGANNGQVEVEMVLQEATDGTNLIEAVLINDVATLA